MKKTAIVLASVTALLLGACQNIFTPTPAPGPTVDSAATSDALFKTAVAQTLTAQPTPTPVTIIETATLPPASPTLVPTETPPEQPTAPATGTLAVPTATLGAGQATASPTLGIRTYGTLPPAVPFSQITLINRAKAEAYISLQVTMPDGKYSIIEYPVRGSIKIQAPVGSYLYVTWVGGRKMVGEFRLRHDEDISITLYRDRVAVK